MLRGKERLLEVFEEISGWKHDGASQTLLHSFVEPLYARGVRVMDDPIGRSRIDSLVSILRAKYDIQEEELNWLIDAARVDLVMQNQELLFELNQLEDLVDEYRREKRA